MLHQEALITSYRHKFEINKVFKEVLGVHGIGHFSLDLVDPNDTMVFFSGTPAHAYEICRRGYGKYDGIISPEYYKNFEFYWWKNASHFLYAEDINQIRSQILKLKGGFMLVRRWNDFYLIYSFAAKSNEIEFQTNVVNNINAFLQIGDWAYEEIRETYAEYTGEINPPVIERFYPFEGGKPPSRYTKSFCPLDTTNNESFGEIIYCDFSKKIILPKKKNNE